MPRQIAGRFMHYTLEQMVTAPGWSNMPEFGRREIITKTIERTRESARALMMAEYPGIIAGAVDAKVKAITGGK